VTEKAVASFRGIAWRRQGKRKEKDAGAKKDVRLLGRGSERRENRARA